ncbi:hypothetical protein SAMN00790413_04753 [Deinococcus hopiensis KR-140]|uniref:Uncharacterized protein n=1 Tax=Deinococcus hopiensis KR-140 TaxID=695939 RepID=A0A1W1UL97_9DEIO|nr:hypothetical protein SAMN00790413_04753 [Deinococcus hopiensis KR-140]
MVLHDHLERLPCPVPLACVWSVVFGLEEPRVEVNVFQDVEKQDEGSATGYLLLESVPNLCLEALR